MALPVTITGISTAVARVGPFKYTALGPFTVNNTGTISTLFGSAAQPRCAQSFVTGAGGAVVTSIDVKLFKQSSPVDTGVLLNIHATDASGFPTGASLGVSNLIPIASITGTNVATANVLNAVFATPVSLAANTKYAVILSRSGATDTTNYYRSVISNTDVYADGSTVYHNGTTWLNLGTTDLYMVINGAGAVSSEAYYFFGRDGTTATTLQAFKSTAPDIDNTLTLPVVAGTASRIGGTTNVTQVSQSFLTVSTMTVTAITTQLNKVASPTDNVLVNIFAADGSGFPTGSSLGQATAIAASSVSSSGSIVTFSFTTPVSLANATSYCAVFSRSGAVDTTNYITISGATTSTYASGNSGALTSGVWGTISASPDFVLEVRSGGWSSVTTKTGFSTAILGLSGYQVGNIIHLAVTDGTLASSLNHKYQTFDASTDTFVTAETIASALATAGQTGAGQPNCSLIVRASGEPVVFFNGAQTTTMGASYARVYYSRRTGVATWAAAVQIDALPALDSWYPEAVLGLSDTVHFLWTDSAGTKQRALVNPSTLQTAGNLGVAYGPLQAVSYDLSGTQKIVVACDGNTVYFNAGNTPTLSSSAADINSGAARMFVDTGATTPTAYYLVVNQVNSDVAIASSTNGGSSWSPDTRGTSIWVGTFASSLTTFSKDGSIYTRGTSVVVPYIVNDSGTLKYNEYVVRYIPYADAWNPNDKGSSLTLSNVDKTATVGAGSGSVRSTTLNPSSSGKYYAEARIDNFISGSTLPLIGLVKSTNALTDNSANCAYATSGSGIDLNGVSSGYSVGGGSVVIGDVIAVAWDTTAQKIWFRKNGGLWNNNGTANPVTGVNGISTSTWAAGNYGVWFWGDTSDAATIRTEVAELTIGSYPAGYTSWMGEAIPVPDAWNAADNYLLTLSNGDKTATGVGTTSSVRSTKTYPTGVAAKLYGEILIGTFSGAVPYIGITTTSADITSVTSVYGTAGAFRVRGAAFDVASGSSGTFPAAFAAGDVVCFAYDAGAELGWARINGGNWNNSGTANPATGTGGLSMSALSGNAALFTSPMASNNVITVRTKVSEFTVASKPSGFTSWMGESMGPAAYSMTADTGAFVVAGPAVALRYTRVKLVAAAGAFALAGQTAGLRKGYKPLGGTGAFTLAGQGVVLARGMPVSAGAFTLAGQTAGLRKGYKLTAEAGAFSLAGQTVALRCARKLPAEAGPIVVAGQDVTLTKTTAAADLTMPADAGAFAVAGQAVALRCIRRLTAETGVFALAGQPAALRIARKLPAGTGAFTLAGQAVVLARGMPAAAGAFAFAGQAVALKYGRGVRAEAGPFTLTGQAATLQYGSAKIIAAGVGSFALAGQPVTLRYTRVMPAGTGAFALAGQPVTLRAARKLPAGTGAFALAGQPVVLARGMPAGTGAFTLAGQTVALKFNRNLVATSVSFAFAGQTVALKYGRGLAAGTGAFALSGQPVTLRYTRVMPAGTGAFAVAGPAVNLRYSADLNTNMLAGTGAFAVTGQTVTLRATHRLVAGTGAFALAGQPAALRTARKLPAGAGAFALAGQPAALRIAYKLPAGTGAFALAGQPVTLRAARKLSAGVGAFALAGQPVNLTVVRAGLNIFPAFYANPNTFYGHVITGHYTLTPVRYDDPDDFYAHTVVSSYDIQPAFYANPDTFYSHTITSYQGLFPELFVNENAFYQHVLIIDQFLAPALFVDPDTFPLASIGLIYIDTEALFVTYENRRMEASAERRAMIVSMEDKSMEVRRGDRVIDSPALVPLEGKSMEVLDEENDMFAGPRERA